MSFTLMLAAVVGLFLVASLIAVVVALISAEGRRRD